MSDAPTPPKGSYINDFFESFLTPLPPLIRSLPSIIRFFGVILDPLPPKIGHHLCKITNISSHLPPLLGGVGVSDMIEIVNKYIILLC